MYKDNTLTYALKCYNFQNCAIESINSGSNKVYKVQREKQNYYLRISTGEYHYISAEIDWMIFLKDTVDVPVLYKSQNNKIIETYKENNKTYIICVFHELPGVFWDKYDPAIWNNTFFSTGESDGKDAPGD